mgnify:CR=1 FL=1
MNIPNQIQQRLPLFLIVITMLTIVGCSSLSGKSTQLKPDRNHARKPIFINAEPTAEEKKWGIRVVGVRSSMGGLMIAFRYKVVDKIKVIFTRLV